jgi:hypothetical protein
LRAQDKTGAMATHEFFLRRVPVCRLLLMAGCTVQTLALR